MFRQIPVDRQDADFQRIIWRESPDQDIQSYRLLTVTYGTTSAPFLAVRVLLQLATDYHDLYPNAIKIIRKNRYVDDFLAGADSVEEARQYQQELLKLLTEVNITLGKWSSNSTSLLPKDHRTEDLPLKLCQEEYVSTLGISWTPSNDRFCFKVAHKQTDTKITKRKILSEVAKLFDPLGWLSPIVIRTKVLLQDLWLAEINWDDQVSPELQDRWLSFTKELPEIENMSIPRWFGSNKHSRLEIHGFSDASERAYTACIYMVAHNDDSVATNLVLGKTKIAPIKTLSMPRLELYAAHLLARLVIEFSSAIDTQIDKTYCWTDAQIALSWLSDHPSKWTTFVATRVSDILTLLPQVQWQHVRS